ncbi:G-type lectin S-receptor-like serine/threonine-protein kinase At4g27290 isoform X2 [Quercus lobata]|uniref:G-type lectin S-receptor-like serine/threonine-protein kinase At4g27290 isoform X2 n=1 Tax=Quercus lobata TaxID=97700 RepID=UPI001244B57A|nr:G-type lectin S-receptor-like serine/threonine-protein kinase At4g27290 isoform X2 [Quercus lobata]
MLETKPLFVFCLLSFLRLSATIDTIIPSHSIRDGETLVSAGGTFELGFFSPGNSKGRYLGIWYRISTDAVVWVANRETPIANRSGVLKVTNEGDIVLFNNTNSTVWSSNTSRAAASPVVKLLDSGNLVVKDGNDNGSKNLLWQSFDYPCDTLMPGMKLGKNFVTSRDWFLTSWKSTDDPAKGEFSLRIDTHGLPQQVSMKGDKIKARGGPWNGLSFSGYPRLRPNPVFKYEFVMNKTEVYYVYTLVNSSVFSRLVFYPSGVWGRLIWRDQTHSWEIYSTSQVDQCENYAYCGAYATCNANRSPVCACLQGFVSKSPKNWNSVDWSDGCFRRTPLECNRDGFLKFTNVKLPDTSSSWFNITMSLEECEKLCLKNCSCTAYSNLDIREKGSGCLLWFGNLNDIRVDQDGQDIYIRLANSELDNSEKNRHSSKIKQVRIIVGSALLVMGILILGVISYVWKKKISFKGITRKNYNYVGGNENMELPVFDFMTIANATCNFSGNNKLGEGGFGPVYKGTLQEGQVVAVKRLSTNSGQGMNEFKNEVLLIAKLQHRNLVKLLGYSVQENEKMLIYEYMPNKSLDSFIFDHSRSKLLNWHNRIHIIGGIARGLLYLHQDSRLRIIHRDLKASNILLDDTMNPKISDFGLARTFGGDQTEAKTKRIVGTHGYMSPEYAGPGDYGLKIRQWN